MNFDWGSRKDRGSGRVGAAATRGVGAAVLLAAATLVGASPVAAKAAKSAKSDCAKVTPKLIKSTLGVVVPAPTQGRDASVLLCTYGQLGSRSEVLVTFKARVSPATFRFERRSVFQDEPTKTFPGLGVPAFSSVQGTGGTKSTTLVALKGGTMVEVSWGGPLAKIAALVRKILPTL